MFNLGKNKFKDFSDTKNPYFKSYNIEFDISMKFFEKNAQILADKNSFNINDILSGTKVLAWAAGQLYMMISMK